jgi:hypothetical protein
MKKLSAHDEREIKDYVKYNPKSLKSTPRSKALKGKGEHLRLRAEVNHTKEGSEYAKEHFRKFGNK